MGNAAFTESLNETMHIRAQCCHDSVACVNSFFVQLRKHASTLPVYVCSQTGLSSSWQPVGSLVFAWLGTYIKNDIKDDVDTFEMMPEADDFDISM